ncbi:hypothetical protein NDN08_008235 [Rhodosorus marinus]|uniref:Queuine tRNA-ribosyltransferase accessory subunit 2 n=1 Tax=Rhodosorus marinus TaxID=101924 RepID=A0AAV8V0X9_9RHOD|nr:hypothetical protein NDN08_008235 [Rhodosorus marinus]
MSGNFHVEARSGKARIGSIKCSNNCEQGFQGRKVLDTPCALVLTRKGSLPNVTNELFPLTSREALVQISLLDFAVFNANDALGGAEVISQYGKGVHGFCSLKGRSTILSVRAAGSQEFLFDVGARKDLIVGELRGQTQRVKVTVDDLLALQQAMSCEFFEHLSVAAPPNASKKQHESSVWRSLGFLDETISRRSSCKGQLLGVVQGGFEAEYRSLSAKKTAERAATGAIGGFMISGFGFGETPDQWETAVAAAVVELPDELPRILTGDGSPERVLRAIELGIDVFDCSYPFDVAEFGIALALESGKVLPGSAPFAQQPFSRCAYDLCGSGQHVNLNDGEHELSRQQIIDKCTCYACIKHTRGYLHHLLRVQEMLAETLICIHNLFNYNSFLKAARESIRAGNFDEFRSNFIRKRRQDAVSQGSSYPQ